MAGKPPKKGATIPGRTATSVLIPGSEQLQALLDMSVVPTHVPNRSLLILRLLEACRPGRFATSTLIPGMEQLRALLDMGAVPTPCPDSIPPHPEASQSQSRLEKLPRKVLQVLALLPLLC